MLSLLLDHSTTVGRAGNMTRPDVSPSLSPAVDSMFRQADPWLSQSGSSTASIAGQTSSLPTSPAPPPPSNGLLAQYYDGLDLTNLRLVRTDATVNFNWGQGAPIAALPADNFSVRWSGQVRPQFSETYTFYTSSDDGVRLWVNGQLLIDLWVNQAPTEHAGNITLAAGQLYNIRLEYYERGGGAVSQLLWSSPSQTKEVVPQTALLSTPEEAIANIVSPQSARSAFSFVDSIGFNTHLRYYDTSYGNYPMLRQRLLELGIRHIRDGGSDPLWIQRTNELASLGIRSTVVIDPLIGTGPDASYDLRPPNLDVLTLVRNLLPNSVEAVEILNEFDLTRMNGYTRRGQPVTDANWVSYLRDFTRDTFLALNSDPATQNVGVIGPSFVFPDSSTLIGDLSQWVDFGNAHPYSYPAHPGNGNLVQDLINRIRPFANRPIVSTEIGYPTSPNDPSRRSVTETVQSKYVPRMFLESFNTGVLRSFAYEFLDQFPDPSNNEYNFGIVRYNGSPKPAYTALQNLIGILNDAATPFTPGSLTYSLTGSTENVRQTLLQKRNGDFYLVLWLEVPSTDQVATQNVTLNLTTPIAQATTYLPNAAPTPIGQYQTPNRLSLTVPDFPLIVQLTPPR